MVVHNIKVTIEKHGFSPTMKKVPYEYDEASKPTIADVIIAIRVYLQELLPTCTAHYADPTGTIAMVNDDEYFDPDDKVFFISKDNTEQPTETIQPAASTVGKKKTKAKKRQKPPSEPGSNSEDNDANETYDNVAPETYNFKIDNKTFVLQKKSSYSKWNTANAATLKIIYGIAKPESQMLVGNVDLFEFYDVPRLRGLIVIMKYHKASPNVKVYNEAEDKLKRSIVTLAYGAFNDNKYTEHAKETTDTVFEWLQHNAVLDWGANGSNGKISHALRSKACRERSYVKNSKRIKKSTHQSMKAESPNTETFEALVTAIKSVENTEAIKAMYDTFPSHRRKWIEESQNNVQTYMELVDLFFEKFPCVRDDFSLLDNDYGYIMNELHGNTPNFAEFIEKYAASIIELAKEQHIRISEEDNDYMVATKAIFKLINKYCKANAQSDYFLISNTATTNINSVITEKNEVTVNPAVIFDTITNTAYCTLGENYYEVADNSFLSALQTTMQLYYIFNIDCDDEVALFFEFMETMTSINKNPKSGFINFKSSLEYVFERIEEENNSSEDTES